MKAAQIRRYSKDIQITVDDIPVPEIGNEDILIRVKAAAVNPVDILNLTGAVRLNQDYKSGCCFPICIAMTENEWRISEQTVCRKLAPCLVPLLTNTP